MRTSRLAARLVREPLVHFALIGAVLFGIEAVRAGGDGPPAGTVSITAEQQVAMAARYERDTGRVATPEVVRGLVRAWVDDELMYREARALGLERGDPIIRRRLVQKMEMVAGDTAVAEPASESELAAYYEDHAARYRAPARYSFTHVFVGGDGRGEAALDEAAAEVARALDAGGDPARLGDPFPRGRAFRARSRDHIAAIFGAGFADALVAAVAAPDAERGGWLAPLASPYGRHVVRVDEVAPAHLPPLAKVRLRVAGDYEQERRRAAIEAYVADLRGRYAVEVEGPAPARVAARGAEGTR